MYYTNLLRIGIGHRLCHPLALVVARSGANGVHVAPVLLRLGVDLRDREGSFNGWASKLLSIKSRKGGGWGEGREGRGEGGGGSQSIPFCMVSNSLVQYLLVKSNFVPFMYQTFHTLRDLISHTVFFNHTHTAGSP